MNKGFTLIELLVVVLIIGVLAYVAIPQYQKAVERARMAGVVQVLGDWAKAQSVYYTQHNIFADDINVSDMTIPKPKNAFNYQMGDGPDDSIALVATRAQGIFQGGKIGIAVMPDGSILKLCQDPVGKTGFCTAAQTAEYLTPSAQRNNNDLVIEPAILVCENCYVDIVKIEPLK